MKFTITTKDGAYKIEAEDTHVARHWVINHCDLSDKTITITEGWNK